MMITAFHPQIISKDAYSAIKLFEALGFQQFQDRTGSDAFGFYAIRMKDSNGFYVDVIEAERIPGNRDCTAIRMNTDDFDEAYQYLIGKGFLENGEFILNTPPCGKYAFLVSPSGFLIDLCQV